MNKPKTILIIIILILLAGNIFFGFRYIGLQKELREAKTSITTYQTNEQVLNFTKLFITKVLKAEKEIDFETRLKLENGVRNLDDQEILAQWKRFTESKTENEAQIEVKNLLEMLINKIKVQ